MAEYNLTYKAAVAKLVALRKSKSITQEQIRVMTKYGLNTIVKFESVLKDGNYSSFEVMEAYCKALGASFKINIHTES